MTRNRTLCSLLAATACFALSAGAQVTGGGSGDEHPPQQTFTISLPGTGTPTSSVAGNFGEGAFTDYAVLRGDEVLVSVDTGSNPWWLETGWYAADLAVRPRSFPTARDRLVSVGASGAYEHVLSSSSTLTQIALETTAWVDAQHVDVGMHDNGVAPELRIVGILTGGTTVGVLTPSGPGSWSHSVLALSHSLPAAAVDMVLADVDGNGELEVAIATPDRLVVYELQSGTRVLNLLQSGYASSSLTSGTKGLEGWLAWTVAKNNKEYLVTVDTGGVSIPGFLGFTPVTGSAALPWSDASRDDLALSMASTGETWVLHDAGVTGPGFSISNHTAMAMEVTTFNGAGEPAVGDIDMDGDLDLITPTTQAGGDRTWVGRSPLVDELLFEVIDSALDNINGEMTAIEWWDCANTTAQSMNPQFDLEIRVSVPPSSPAAGADEVAFTVWMQEDDGGNGPEDWDTDPSAVSSQTSVALVNREAVVRAVLPDPGTWECLDAYVTTHIYHIELQLRTTGGQTWPAKLLGVQTEVVGGTNASYLNGLRVSGSSRYFIVPFDDNGGDPAAIGSADEMPELPNLMSGPIVYNP